MTSPTLLRALVGQPLRDQVRMVGVKHVSGDFVQQVDFPTLVYELARRMFEEAEVSTIEAQIVRRALKLLRSPGWVTEDEPGLHV